MIQGAIVGLVTVAIFVAPFVAWVAIADYFHLPLGAHVLGLILTYGAVFGAVVGALR